MEKLIDGITQEEIEALEYYESNFWGSGYAPSEINNPELKTANNKEVWGEKYIGISENGYVVFSEYTTVEKELERSKILNSRPKGYFGDLSLPRAKALTGDELKEVTLDIWDNIDKSQISKIWFTNPGCNPVAYIQKALMMGGHKVRWSIELWQQELNDDPATIGETTWG